MNSHHVWQCSCFWLHTMSLPDTIQVESLTKVHTWRTYPQLFCDESRLSKSNRMKERFHRLNSNEMQEQLKCKQWYRSVQFIINPSKHKMVLQMTRRNHCSLGAILLFMKSFSTNFWCLMEKFFGTVALWQFTLWHIGKPSFSGQCEQF